MQVTWAEKPAKDFMIIGRIKSIFFILLTIGCNSDLSDDPIPPASFPDIQIDINLPEYVTLRTDGGFKEISGGVRGIIVYRANGTSFQAYEKNCSYHPNDACATVSVHSSGLYMTDSCCGSNFSFADGTPTGGQAWRPLRRYRTQFSNSRLIISDEALN
jgi:hypothetical protein